MISPSCAVTTPCCSRVAAVKSVICCCSCIRSFTPAWMFSSILFQADELESSEPDDSFPLMMPVAVLTICLFVTETCGGGVRGKEFRVEVSNLHICANRIGRYWVVYLCGRRHSPDNITTRPHPIRSHALVHVQMDRLPE